MYALVDFLNSGNNAGKVYNVIGAFNWAGIGMRMWKENPSISTPILWMALESLFEGCVYRHKHCNTKAVHWTALDVYADNLQDVLADNVLAYVQGIAGSETERQRRQRVPPYWWQMATRLRRREEIGAKRWLKDLHRQLLPHWQEDPLLFYRTRQLVHLFDSVTFGHLLTQREEDLELLYAARNLIAHTGRSILDEGLSAYLSSFALNLFKLGVEREVLNGR